MDIKFIEAFLGFVAKAEAMIAADRAANFPNLSDSKLGYDEGSKYIRVFKYEPGPDGEKRSRYAYCFVSKENGDVLKCDGWKKPAKHARGNIYSDKNGLEGVGVYGAKYL